jgi:cytochrome c oxidase subunit 2
MPKFRLFTFKEAMLQRIVPSFLPVRSIVAAFVFSLVLPVSGLFGQDLKKGESFFQVCVACHGPEGLGNPLLNAPAIAGLDIPYVETQLHNFKHGIRGADARDSAGLQMRPMSMTLQDEQAIKDVAAFVGTLKPKVPNDTLHGGDIAKGEATYALCLACHGPDAAGNPLLKSPSLQYQSDWYMLRQLKKFKEGIRGSNPQDIGGMQMRPMSMTLADEQAMKDVIAYIRSISPKE